MDEYFLAQNGNIIHQIWFLDGILPRWKSRKLLKSLKKYQDSWITKNPSWKYKCWDNTECRNIMKTFFPEHFEMYDSYPYEIQRCDCIRYFILYRYGGVYADMDYCCVRPWSEVVTNYPLEFYATETPNKMNGDVHVSNSLIY